MGIKKAFLSALFALLLLLNLPKNSIPSFTREMICSMTLYPSGWYIGWQNKTQKEDLITKGMYRPKNILPTRFQMFNDSIFVALPRFRCGVPFSLGMLDFKDFCKAEPLMYPYPSWFANRYDSDDSVHNAVDLIVDLNGILWVLDTGVINTLTSPKIVDMPRVIGYCLKTAKVGFSEICTQKVLIALRLIVKACLNSRDWYLKHADFSELVCADLAEYPNKLSEFHLRFSIVVHIVNLSPFVTDKSRFQYIEVETYQRQTFIYVSDAGSNLIIVWDTTRGQGFKVLLPNNVRDGAHSPKEAVLYVALLKGRCNGSFLYFTYLHGKKLFHIDTQNLRSGKTTGGIEEDGVKPGRIVLLGTDHGTTLFFRIRGKADIYMWNSTQEFRSENLILAQPIDNGRFPTHVTSGYRSLIWTLESNFPDFMEDRVNELGPSARIHPTIKFCGEEV